VTMLDCSTQARLATPPHPQKIARDRPTPESIWRGPQRHQPLQLQMRPFVAGHMEILMKTFQYCQLADQRRAAMREGIA
jgi:hypothetical protein